VCVFVVVVVCVWGGDVGFRCALRVGGELPKKYSVSITCVTVSACSNSPYFTVYLILALFPGCCSIVLVLRSSTVSHTGWLAAILFISGVLLLYTVIMAPVQIFVWEFDEDECNVFPTMYFDICVDIFFMVKFSFDHIKYYSLVMLGL
jgi:hypothetical protein